MQIIVIVSQEVAPVLHQQASPTTKSEELRKLITKLDVSLKPLFPFSSDTHLDHYFMVEVPDLGTAKQTTSCLLQSKAVEGAYVKPLAQLP